MDQSRNLSLGLSEVDHLRKALDQAAIVAFTDSRGVITYVNDKFCEISKYSRKELIGKTHRLVNSAFHSPHFFKDMWNTISSGKVWNGEIKNKAKDGSFYWVETTIVPFLINSIEGPEKKLSPFSYVAIRFDITQQKESEENFRQLFNASLEGTLVHQQGVVLNANDAAAKILNFPASELTDRKLIDFFPTDAHASILNVLEAKEEVHTEIILTRQNGSRAFLRLSSKPFLYRGLNSHLITIRDESEQRILQGKLAQQERLASVGFLASGLAHEIGTPLGVIRGRAEYLSMYPDNQSTVRSNMEIIISQIDRISKLIYSLLNVARKDNLETVSNVNVNDAIEDVRQLLSSSFSKEGILLDFSLPEPIFVRANKSQLEQIFLNLLVNSLHAIKSKKSQNSTESYCVRLRAEPRSDCWEFSITDNGSGISEDNLRHIFEPFFTTKDPGHGTGLGLSIVQQMIFAWNGNIRCESQLGKGTSFLFQIPRA